ncbi:MAG: rhomboid family intramembrane serine protease [Anaerolineae bacterium]|nr:rhomboid family intramembrane serine protease [Anaerolineae bacterium]
MIPIGDNDLPNRRLSIVNWLLIGVNVLVFLYELTLTEPALQNLFMTWGTVPSRIINAAAHPTSPDSLQAFSTLITAQFLHGGWLHIIGNMLFLYVFGDNIEEILGSGLYLLFYLFSGVVAGLAQTFVLAQMMGAENVPGIGASGAIAGVLGAYIVLYPTRRINVLTFIGLAVLRLGVPALVMIGIWFIEQLFVGVTSLAPGAAASNVGYWAHIGGFVAGLILILPFKGRARPNISRRLYNP